LSKANDQESRNQSADRAIALHFAFVLLSASNLSKEIDR
jgi:hypothetical protein